VTKEDDWKAVVDFIVKDCPGKKGKKFLPFEYIYGKIGSI